ncbi:MAG: hypothetical protein E7318_11040 [Clostridiales bacterium]|nr:hypothetical protein [Clostridiales bacterium]
MFRKYTALAAAILLASSMTTSLAECAVNQPCNSTCGDVCATYQCSVSTCNQICATCWDCNTTCSTICGIYPPADPTAVPQPTPTVQPTQKPSATQTPAPGDDYTTQSVSAQEQKMVNLLNQDRKNNGRTALTLDPELCRIARIKSADMRDNRYFAHESPTYGRVGQMLKHFGYRFSAAGENIAHHANVDKAQAAFMSSQGHRANILSTAWTKVGVGIVQDANGYIYATQIFAK